MDDAIGIGVLVFLLKDGRDETNIRAFGAEFERKKAGVSPISLGIFVLAILIGGCVHATGGV